MTEINSHTEHDKIIFVRRYWAAIVVPCLLVGCFFLFLYSGFKQTILEEVRNYARFAATATSFALDPDEVAKIRGPDDVKGETYQRLLQILEKYRMASTDISYAYILRRSSVPNAKLSDYEYVVDLPPRTEHQGGWEADGVRFELPGTPMDASLYPAMINAWQEPDADNDVSPNPPYPDVLSAYAPIRNSKGETIAIVCMDITERMIVRKLHAVWILVLVGGTTVGLLIFIIITLYCQYREVLHQVQKMNAELQQKHLQMKALSSLRDDLSHMIAHDLRNKLTVISGCTDLLARMPDGLSKAQQETLQEEHEMLLNGSLHEMSVLLENMLLLAKNESARLEPQLRLINVKDLLADAINRCKVIARSIGISVEMRCATDQPLIISADPHLLLRVADNLLINALKHSPHASTVQLLVETSDQVSGQQPWKVRIKVTDQGPGVDPVIKAQLFERFAAGDSITSDTRSIGLGLAFCKMAVEAHNGRIYLEDSKVGAIFVIELP
jgi:signal transduction histidine kinase